MTYVQEIHPLTNLRQSFFYFIFLTSITLGRLTTVCGRASATIRMVRPARKSAGGMWRWMPGPRPVAPCTNPRWL